MFMPRSRHSRRVAGALATLFVLACSGGGSTDNGDNNPPPPGPPGPPTNTPSATLDVAMQSSQDPYGSGENNYYSPNSANLTLGGTVTWSNGTGVTHNVTFTTPNSPANIPNMSSGSAVRTFTTAGAYDYHCTNHQGMDGRITVVQ
jgi:plastocyanin